MKLIDGERAQGWVATEEKAYLRRVERGSGRSKSLVLNSPPPKKKLRWIRNLKK